jgi:hypothetical protein
MDVNSDGSYGGCTNPIGVGMAFDGKLLAVARGSSAICSVDPSNITSDIVTIPVGEKPYTYSDFTGNLFRSFTKPDGYYRLLAEGCPSGFRLARWVRVTWEAELPGTSRMEVRFRFGRSVGQAINPVAPQLGPVLQTGPQPTPQTFTYELPASPDSDYLQVEFRFLADENGVAPKLHSADVTRTCLAAE